MTLGAIFIFGFVLVRAFFYFPSDEVPLPQDAIAKTVSENGVAKVIDAPNFDLSMRLLIPSIKVDAKIIEVGVTKKGNMAAPRNFSDVGWYKYGTFPGDKGSAVIAGHVDNGLAFPAVFSNLKNLKKGDDIFIQDKDGVALHFIVTRSDVYDFDSAPEGVFDDKSGKYLKLITCTGVWLSEYRTHNKRLVVTSVLADK